MFTALAMFLSLGAGALNIWGQAKQASENKKVAREDVARAEKDLIEGREMSKGSILAGSAAAGVSGDSLDTFVDRSSSKFNDQLKLNQEGLDKFIKNTDTNFALNTVSTILGVGSSVVSSAYDAGWFNNSKPPTQGYSTYNSSKPWKSIY